MERDWLIRTSQNQILGPVAKAKLLEFIQKGALGLTDEVASGNGYWFALKEKDLVEKYIYGDIPQGYNPISESKSVLAGREHPDKTSSINTAPANRTQVLKMSDLAPGLAPKSEDLEFPDVAAPAAVEVTKLPTQDDLEFPDLNAVAESVNQSFQYSTPSRPVVTEEALVEVKMEMKVEALKVEQASSEEIVLPNEDDLAFPDMENFHADKTSTKVEKGKVDLDQHYTRTVALDNQQAIQVIPAIEEKMILKSQQTIDNDFGDVALSLDTPVREEPAPLVKKERIQIFQPGEDNKKLLHDRKTKSSSKPAAQRDPTREVAHKDDHQSGPLKKRNDNYIFFILIILILIILAVFFYFKEILNKPLPV